MSKTRSVRRVPKIGSGGPAGTVAHVDANALGDLLVIILDAKRARSIFARFRRGQG
jgi:hypothetical protein